MDGKPLTMVADEEETKQLIAPIEEEEEEEEEKEEEEEDIEALAEPPDWLPDGWIMEVYRTNDGTINRYYTSPISNYTFTMKSEVLEHLFSQTDERMLESKESGAENTFQKEHEWLPKGWLMEIRAGGSKMNKMYKFYVYPKTGIRLQSKQDVILYINEAKVSQCDTNGQCDTSSEDNMLALVDFQPSGLPEGWVKELVFRKTKEGLIRRDPYYTDPASSYTFRTLKSAFSFIETGKVPMRAFTQKTSICELYSFDKSADLHQSLRTRLIINEKPYLKAKRSSRSRGTPKIEYEDSDTSQDGDTSIDSDSPDEMKEENTKCKKATGKELALSSKTFNHPTGRPQQFKIKEEVADSE